MSITAESMTPADIRACTCGNDGYGNGNGMFGNDAWWIIVLLLFGWGGRGFGGFGGGYGGGSGVGENYVLATDFATIERKLDGINNGICDATFQLTNNINGNFRTLDGAICNLGYQALQNTNAIQTQLAGCCCDIQGAIKDVAYGNAMNANAIQQQISSCCCDIEKMNMQSRFDAQAYNCNTLQAIDKLGDRIVDHSGKLDKQGYVSVAEQLVKRFGCKKVAVTLRTSLSAFDNLWAGMLYDAKTKKACFSNEYALHIVDRVGGGDSFGGALIYALATGGKQQAAIDFAVAASALKHSIEQDFNLVSAAEVVALAAGNGTGRVQR